MIRVSNLPLSRTSLFVAALSLGGLMACETAEPTDPEDPAEELGSGFIRVLHLSGNTPAVDVFVNDGEPAAIPALAFPSSTDYVELEEGEYEFDIAVADQGIENAALTVPGVNIEADRRYTAVAFENADGLTAAIIEDDDADIGAGNFRVRFFHAAPGVGEVDIWNVTEGADPAPLFENVGTGENAGTLDIPAGAYTLGADVNNDAVVDLYFEIPSQGTGTVANLYATQDADGAVFVHAQLAGATTARIDPATSQARVMHLSGSTPNVEVFVNGAEPAAIGSLGFAQSTDYISFTSATYRFDIGVEGGGIDATVLPIEGVSMAPNKWYTAFAYEGPDGLTASIIEDSVDDMAGGNFRVRFIHAAPGVGEVDIWNVTAGSDPAPLFENVATGQNAGTLDIPAGAYSLGVDVDDDGVPDLTFDVPEQPAGGVANLYATQDENDAVFVQAQLDGATTARIDPNP